MDTPGVRRGVAVGDSAGPRHARCVMRDKLEGRNAKRSAWDRLSRILINEGGIRTHGSIAATPDFESGTFDHSATSPRLEAEIIAGNLRVSGRNADF